MKTILKYPSLFILLLSLTLPIKANNQHHHRDIDNTPYNTNIDRRELNEMKELSHRFERSIMNRRFHKAHSIKHDITVLMQEDISNSRYRLQEVNQDLEYLKRKVDKQYHKRNHHHNNGRGHGPHNGYYSGKGESYRLYAAIERAKSLKWELKDQIMHKKRIFQAFKKTEGNRRFSLNNDRMEIKQFIRKMRQDLEIGINQNQCH